MPEESGRKSSSKRLMEERIKSFLEKDPDTFLEILLETPFWPQSLELNQLYIRQADDTDEEMAKLGVSFLLNMDAVIITTSYIKGEPGEENSLESSNYQDIDQRFRNELGGGMSSRTYLALIILARAIQLDNLHNPQKPDSPPNT